VENRFENKKYTIAWFRDEKIVEFNINELELEREDIIEMHKQTILLTKDEKYASIFTAKDFMSITGDARAEGAKPMYSGNLIAQALIVKNLAQRLVGNFIMKFNSPAKEMKMFSTYEEGKAWVLKKIKEYEANSKIKGVA
jgi:hypothetical protein